MLASALVLLAFLAVPPSALAAFGFESSSSAFIAAGGLTGAMPAGTHPESWTTALAFNASGPPEEGHPEGSLKDLRIELPIGLVAAPTLLPQCSHVDFVEDACPPSTAVGSIDLVTSKPLSPPTVFLLEPVPGSAAELGFHASQVPVTIDISLSSTPPYALFASITGVSQVTELFGATLQLDGVPDGRPFLLLPRSCTEPLQTSLAASSWNEPDTSVFAATPEPQSLFDCGDLSYAPTVQVTPTTVAAASPSGLDLQLDAPDPGLASPTGRAAADTSSATLSLPPGLTINPPVATGLSACSPDQLAAEEPESPAGQGCPDSSRLGTATVTTPLFPEAIEGAIYLVRPGDAASAMVTGPSGTRLTLEVVFRDPARGVLLELPLHVDADAQTGRLTTSMEEIPQLPISQLQLHFNSGARAPLSTPAACGPHSIDYSLTPSSGNPPLTDSQSFSTTSSECSPGFAPSLKAGTESNAGGSSAPFTFELSQGAATPDLTGISLTLPPGLSASFSAASPCPESDVAGGGCPVGSKLGYARIAVGAGPEPIWIPGGEEPDSGVYLAGPYRGAPYSLVIVVPAQAGPFDLGDVIVRAPITVDPTTAQATLDVEGLPQILDGVPLHYRTIRVVLDRPGFIRNPTSCEPSAITGVARAADGSSAAISARFQAVDCGTLGFRPRLSVRLSGGIRRNGHPTVSAVLGGDPNGAAISSANITLPSGELLDLRHLHGLCPREVAAARCPGRSLLGNLRLVTPLLEGALEGPVYLRVPAHRLPELSAEVRSGRLSFVVDGRITQANGRFGVKLESMPDIPITKAVLTIRGGHRGILANSRSLCDRRAHAEAGLSAHNGARRRVRVPVRVDGCR
jgi:hypothetical protein